MTNSQGEDSEIEFLRLVDAPERPRPSRPSNVAIGQPNSLYRRNNHKRRKVGHQHRNDNNVIIIEDSGDEKPALKKLVPDTIIIDSSDDEHPSISKIQVLKGISSLNMYILISFDIRGQGLTPQVVSHLWNQLQTHHFNWIKTSQMKSSSVQTHHTMTVVEMSPTARISGLRILQIMYVDDRLPVLNFLKHLLKIPSVVLESNTHDEAYQPCASRVQRLSARFVPPIHLLPHMHTGRLWLYHDDIHWIPQLGIFEVIPSS